MPPIADAFFRELSETQRLVVSSRDPEVVFYVFVAMI